MDKEKEYYYVMKKDYFVSSVGKQMDPETMMPSEVCQSQRAEYHMASVTQRQFKEQKTEPH